MYAMQSRCGFRRAVIDGTLGLTDLKDRAPLGTETMYAMQ